MSLFMHAVLLLSMQIALSKVPCDPDSFQFIDSPRIIEKNGKYTFRISNAQEVGCAVNVTYEWTLYQRFGRELRKVPYGTRALKYPGKSKNMFNEIDMEKVPKTADGSLQHFAMKVILIPGQTHYPSYRIWYFGEEAPIPDYIVISGGRERTHWMEGYRLWLNTTGPDGDAVLANLSNPVWNCVPPFNGIRPPNTLKWSIPEFYLIENMTHTCTVTVDLTSGKKESAYQVIHIRSYAGIPQIEVRCRHNCEQASTFKETYLDFYCHGICQGDVHWTVKPYAEAYMKASTILTNNRSVDAESIVFKEKTFKPNSTMDFIAVLGEATANYTIHFRMPKPQLVINCFENCIYKHSSSIKFQVKCTAECDDLSYSWACRPIPATPWKLNSPKNDIIIFPPFSFSAESDVKLEVLAGLTRTSLEFTTGTDVEAVLNIVCKSNCNIYDPRLPVTLVVDCISNCLGENNFEYVWTVSVPRPGYHWYDHTLDGNRTLVIPANTYRDTDDVEFWVYGSSGSAKERILFHTEKAELELICVDNCDPDETHPNAHEVVNVRVKCSSECSYGPYTWWLEPAPEDFNYTAHQVSEDGVFFTIPANLYREGDEVTLSVKKGTGESFIIINFIELKPTFEILCLVNCITPSDPLADTVLRVECIKTCDDFLIEWRPDPKRDLWYDHYELGSHNATLMVKGGTYKDGDVVDYGSFSKNNAEEHLHLTYNTPEVDFILECIENCNKSWTAFKTVLAVRCYSNCLNLGFRWNIIPEPDRMKWTKSIRLSDDNATLTILPLTFQHEDVITVKVEIIPTKTSVGINFRREEQVGELKVEFEELFPILALTCEPVGCNATVNRLEPVNLSVNCLKYCEGSSYAWELEPLPRGFVWDEHSVRGIENTTLKLRPAAVQHGENITVTVSKGTGKALGYLVFKDPLPDIAIVCVENCNASNPQKPVLLRAQCYSLCDYITEFNEYFWGLSPEAKVYPYIGPRHETYKIMEQSYGDGAIVNVTLTWGQAKAVSRIAFIEPAPSLEIFCLRNCKYNPKAAAVFEVRCMDNCMKTMAYKWLISPSPKKPVHYLHNMEALKIFENSYEAYDLLNLTVVTGKSHTTKIVIYMESKPSLALACIENCNYQLKGNPRRPTTFLVTCEKECETLEYKWLLDQPPINFNPKSDLKISRDKSRMVLRANLYQNDTLVRVYVTSGRSNTSLDIYFMEPVPVLVVLCVENCGYPDPYEILILNVTCLKNCDHVSYAWHVTPQPREFSWRDNIVLGKENVTLTVLGNTYEDDEQVLFIVQSGDAKAELHVTFTVPAPVLEISCSPDCQHANPYEILLIRVNCLQFCHNPFYLWGLKPTLPGFEWHLNITEGPDNSSISIMSDTFISGSDTNAIVVSNKSAYAIAQIHFEVQEPEMAIVCKENCIFHPWHPITFYVECRKHCMDFKYNCSLSPPPEDPDNDIAWLPGGLFSIRNRSYHERDVVTIRCNSKDTEVISVVKMRLNDTDIECRLFPERGGISVKTRHTMDCYYVPENVTFRIYQRIPGLPVHGVLLWHGPHSYVTDLLFSATEGSNIILLVGRSWDLIAYQRLALHEEPFVKFGGTENEWNAVKYRILGNKLNDYQQLLRVEEYQRAIQLAAALDTVLEDFPPLFEIHYRRHLLEDILSVMNQIEPSQVMSLMSKMTFKPYLYPLPIYHLLMEGVRFSVERILNWNRPSPQYSTDTLYNVTLEAVLTAGKICMLSKAVIGDRKEYLTSEDNIANEGDWSHVKYITNDFFRIIDTVTVLVRLPGAQVLVQGNGIFLKILDLPIFKEKQEIKFHRSASSAIIAPFGTSDPRKYLPPFLNVTFRLVFFKTTPFWWDKAAKPEEVETVYFGMDVQQERIEYAPFEINLKVRSNNVGEIISQVNGDPVVYEFVVLAHSTLQISFIGDSLTLYIGNWYPSNETLKKNGTKVTSSNDAPFYFYSPLTKIYVGITGKGQFIARFVNFQCLNWHGDSWTWDSQNCRALEPQPSADFLSCKCTRMSIFTGNRIVPTYVSDNLKLSEPFYGTLKRDWYSEITGGVVFIIIIIAMIIAIVLDLKIQRQYKLQVLEDNRMCDSFKYVAAVQTGVMKGCGTTARVAVQIIGEKGVSRVHLLNGKNATRLQRNSFHLFLFYTRVHLGEITALRVWHDSSGDKPHWFCNSIVVRDVQTRQRYIFLISRWFSLLWGDGTTIGIFYPRKRTAGTVNFDLRLDESLRINHSYFGFLTDRATPHSNKQYVAVSSVSILLTMLILLIMVHKENLVHLTDIFPAIFSAAFGGVIVATVLDVLFRVSRS